MSTKNKGPKKSLVTESERKRFQGLAGISGKKASAIHPLYESYALSLQEQEDEEDYEGDEEMTEAERTGLPCDSKKVEKPSKGQPNKDQQKGHVLSEMEEEGPEVDDSDAPEDDNLPSELPDSSPEADLLTDESMGSGADGLVDEETAATVLRAVAQALGVNADVDTVADDIGDDGVDFEDEGFPDDDPGYDDLGYDDPEEDTLMEGLFDLVRKQMKQDRAKKEAAKNRQTRTRDAKFEEFKKRQRAAAARQRKLQKSRERS